MPPSAAGLDFIISFFIIIFYFYFMENQTFTLSEQASGRPDPSSLPTRWWLGAGDGAEAVKRGGWELRQLPARMMFRLAGFPGILLSKRDAGACP